MAEHVILIGAGGHGKVIADVVSAAGDEVVGFLDDNLERKMCGSYPVLGAVKDAHRFSDCWFVISIGSNSVRRKIAEALSSVHWYTAIHPSAVISPSAKIGEGTVVMPYAVINAEAEIGRHCIINTAAVVEHENQISDYVHISPRAALAGNVTVGEQSHIGIGACVCNNITICEGCTIGAGAAVVKDITQRGVYVGVPAGMLRYLP